MTHLRELFDLTNDNSLTSALEALHQGKETLIFSPPQKQSEKQKNDKSSKINQINLIPPSDPTPQKATFVYKNQSWLVNKKRIDCESNFFVETEFFEFPSDWVPVEIFGCFWESFHKVNGWKFNSTTAIEFGYLAHKYNFVRLKKLYGEWIWQNMSHLPLRWLPLIPLDFPFSWTTSKLKRPCTILHELLTSLYELTDDRKTHQKAMLQLQFILGKDFHSFALLDAEWRIRKLFEMVDEYHDMRNFDAYRDRDRVEKVKEKEKKKKGGNRKIIQRKTSHKNEKTKKRKRT